MGKSARHALVAFIKKWRMEWAVSTVLSYLVLIPVTIIYFPANSMWTALVVLYSGLSASLVSLADLLISADANDDIKDTNEQIDELK